MATFPQKTLKVPKVISYREIMIYWGIGARSAQNRLTTCRDALSKRKGQLLHVEEYCRWEGITRHDFDKEYLDSYR